MKSLFHATALVALLAAAPALAQTTGQTPGAASPKPGTSSSTQRSEDARFIQHVAQDNQAEVELGQLAQQKAQSPEVKALGQRLAADHAQANQQLTQIAQKEGVQPPKGIGKEKSQERAKLEKLSGQAFDRAFVQTVVQDHQKDIQYFQREATAVQDPQLKSFTQQSLPVLQQHLQMAQQVQSHVASGSSSAPSPSAGSPGSRTTR